MKRIVPVLLLVAAIAFFVFSGGDDEGGTVGESGSAAFRPDRVSHIEELIRNRDVEGAQRALAAPRGMNDAEIAYGEAIVALTGEDNETALERARAARAKAPGAWRPLSIEVAALMALGREAELGQAIREALERLPDDERVLAMAAQHFATSAADLDPRRAGELLARFDALETRKAPPPDPTAVDETALLQVRYSAAMATGAYGNAQAAARELIRETGGHPATHVLLGEAARRDDDLKTALESYRRAVQLAPDQLPWQLNLVQMLLEIPGMDEEALERTRDLLRRWPAERAVGVVRARALVRAHETLPDGPDRAVTIYRRLLQENPEDLEVLRNLALVLYDWKLGGQEGTYLDESHRLLQRYVLLGGEIDERLRSTWETLQRRAREQAAASGPDELPERAAFEADPSNAAAAAGYRAALVAAGRLEEAGEVVRRLLEAAPEHAGVQALAARHFMADGPDHDAVASLHHMDRLTEMLGGEEGLSETLLWLRARALLETRRHTEALEDARTLMTMRPAAVPYLELGARAALALDRRAEAETWLREALAVEERPELRELLDDVLGE